MIYLLILAAIVVAFCCYAVWYMNREVATKGITTVAPITRVSDGGGKDDFYYLTFEWTDLQGRGREATKLTLCDSGDLPRVGDCYQITYLPDDDNYIELNNPGFLRHDQAVAKPQ